MFLVPITGLAPIQELETIERQNMEASPAGGRTFSSIMEDVMSTLQQSQAAAAQDSYDLAMGDVSNLHSLMIHSAMEATAVETAVQLTSRAVSAYKEMMQMQI